MDLIETERAIIAKLESENGFVTGICYGPLTEQAVARLVNKGVLTEVEEGWLLGEKLTESSPKQRNSTLENSRSSARSAE